MMKWAKMTCFFVAVWLLVGGLMSCASPPEDAGGESDTQEMISGTDEDGMKYTTVCLTDSGLAITPSYDVNGNIASFVHTRESFAEVAKTFADMGVSRVYAVTSRPGVVGSSSAPNQWNDPGDNTSQDRKSVV